MFRNTAQRVTGYHPFPLIRLDKIIGVTEDVRPINLVVQSIEFQMVANPRENSGEQSLFSTRISLYLNGVVATLVRNCLISSSETG